MTTAGLRFEKGQALEEAIVTLAEADAREGRRYYWAPPRATLGILLWIGGSISCDEIGRSEGTAICDFDYFILLCIRRKLILRERLRSLYLNAWQVGPDCAAGSHSYWRYRLNARQDWPRSLEDHGEVGRGDIVFFHSPAGRLTDHAALVCGTTDDRSRAEVISFGEGLESPRWVGVHRTTVGALERRGYEVAVFARPFWSSLCAGRGHSGSAPRSAIQSAASAGASPAPAAILCP